MYDHGRTKSAIGLSQILSLGWFANAHTLPVGFLSMTTVHGSGKESLASLLPFTICHALGSCLKAPFMVL